MAELWDIYDGNKRKTGRTAEQLEKSRKSSYVFRGVVWTFISITIAYIL